MGALELAEMSAPRINAHGESLLGSGGQQRAVEMVTPLASGPPSFLLALFACTQRIAWPASK